jgi:hypothetical protein
MQQKRNIPRSSPSPTGKSARFELRPDRAFVLQLDVRAQLPRHVVGRVEHVTSGQAAYVTSLGELMAFMAKVLRNQDRGEPGTAYATLAQEPCQNELASSTPPSLAEDATGSAAQPPLRGRKRGSESWTNDEHVREGGPE